MEALDAELGPIDIVVIGYPAGAPMTGEAVPLLLELIDRGIIRVRACSLRTSESRCKT